MLRSHSHYPLLVLIAALSFLGCASTPGDGDDDSTSGPATETTGETTDSPAETSDSPDETETGAEPGLCTESCTVAADCGELSLEECVAECEQYLTDLEDVPECIPPTEALYTCVAGLDCEEFAAYFEGAPGAPCSAEEQALGECGDPGCTLEIDGDADGCFAEFSCTGDEEVYTVECSFAEGCVCRLDGMEVGTCVDAALVCTGEPEQQYPGINACCGWTLDP